MLRAFFASEGITEHALLSMEDVRVKNEGLYARMFPEKKPCAVSVFLIPYFTRTGERNLSRYALSRDYHLYVRDLSARAKKLNGFLALCADHSPLDERHAALVGGLGVLGKNGLLLNETYGSYCFIGEIFFSEISESVKPAQPIGLCPSCGACQSACVGGCLSDPAAPCLSAVSQKKEITPGEAELLKQHGILWGCDVCQDVCPLNAHVPETPLSFFREDLICCLEEAGLGKLIKSGEFSRRAYAWRGEKPIRRNLRLLEKEGERNRSK